MLAWFSDDVSIALIAAVASVAAAGVGIVGVVIATGSKRIAVGNQQRLDTGNGHTAGESLARIEEHLERHDKKLDELRAYTMTTREKVTALEFNVHRHQYIYRHDRIPIAEVEPGGE